MVNKKTFKNFFNTAGKIELKLRRTKIQKNKEKDRKKKKVYKTRRI